MAALAGASGAGASGPTPLEATPLEATPSPAMVRLRAHHSFAFNVPHVRKNDSLFAEFDNWIQLVWHYGLCELRLLRSNFRIFHSDPNCLTDSQNPLILSIYFLILRIQLAKRN